MLCSEFGIPGGEARGSWRGSKSCTATLAERLLRSSPLTLNTRILLRSGDRSSQTSQPVMSAGVAYAGPSGQTAYVLCAGQFFHLAHLISSLASTRPTLLTRAPADCGTPIQPNGANLCVNCLRNSCVVRTCTAHVAILLTSSLPLCPPPPRTYSVDITEGIPKQTTVNFCRGCERYLSPPAQWTRCELESRELLAICLRKLKGLSKVRLIDAGFIWTEPHSKRLRVKLTIQKEVRTPSLSRPFTGADHA